MTVKQMIEVLQQLPQEYEVLLSTDAEGNRYAKFAECGGGKIIDARHAYDVEAIASEDWDNEYSAENVYPGDDAVILWPA